MVACTTSPTKTILSIYLDLELQYCELMAMAGQLLNKSLKSNMRVVSAPLLPCNSGNNNSCLVIMIYLSQCHHNGGRGGRDSVGPSPHKSKETWKGRLTCYGNYGFIILCHFSSNKNTVHFSVYSRKRKGNKYQKSLQMLQVHIVTDKRLQPASCDNKPSACIDMVSLVLPFRNFMKLYCNFWAPYESLICKNL